MQVSSESEINQVTKAAAISTEILHALVQKITPGMTGVDIDQLTGDLCKQHGVKPAFRNNPMAPIPFEANLCVSINDEVLHGFPSDKQIVKEGDLVKLDFGILYEGIFTDQCVTVGVGKLSAQDERLAKTAKLLVESAVSKVAPGVRVGVLGYTMHSIAQAAGFDVLKEFVGHGIGKSLWEDPQIPAYGIPTSGAKLKVGQVICVEAQVVAGSDEVYIDDDGWTVKTVDSSHGVMFEYMVLVTDKGFSVLTDTKNWPIII